MKLRRELFITVTLLLTSLIAGSAQDARKANETLLRATSPFEDMVGFALSKKEARITKSLAAADAQAAAVKEALRPADAGQFQELLQAIHKAAAAKEDYAVATNAVEVFRLLVDNLKADILKV